MVEPFTNEISPDALPHHPAVRAWCEFQRAWTEPGRIEALKVECTGRPLTDCLEGPAVHFRLYESQLAAALAVESKAHG